MPATNEIGIVVYPGVQAAPVHGLTDLFGIAAGIALDQQRHDRVPLRVTHWKPAHSRGAYEVTKDDVQNVSHN
jgi:transcriptional regulator GlxA family with amidase domain